MSKYDLVVIGSGPGGYIAAIRGTQLGMKTAIIEREHLGGICLNWGCIPTKALLKASEVYHTIKHAEEFGITYNEPKIDFKKLIARSRDVAKKLNAGIDGLMKKNKIDVLNGHGKLLGKGQIEIVDKDKKSVVESKHIIIATGARARELPNIKPDGKIIWTYKEAMTPDTLPKKLLIVGSGAIGIEFASFYNMLGTDVTVVELADRILNAEDKEISAYAQKCFEKSGIKFLLNSNIKDIKKSANAVDVVIIDKDKKDHKLTFDRIISAVGVVANIENIGLENTKVKLEKGFIKTDEFLQTEELGVYAIGDVTSPPWLAHKASHEGVLCVEKINGIKGVHTLKKTSIPGCTYSYPQVASIGLTEDAATALGHNLKVGRYPYYANGKAIALGETDGMVKVIFDEKTGELLGAHMIGAEVTEMIHAFVVGKALECTEEDLMHTVFAHPTLSEMIHESVLNAYGKTLNL